MNPVQDCSTTAGSESVFVNLVNPLEENKGHQKPSWDIQASSIVFGLFVFGCTEHVIHSVLLSYGFRCSIKEILQCINRYRFLSYHKLPYPVNGPISKMFFQFGVDSNVTFNYAYGYLTSIIHDYEPLCARAPLSDQSICSVHDRQIKVELNKGQIQIRALNLPDLDHGL